MNSWRCDHGFQGPLSDLLEAMWELYPNRASIVDIQDWLIRRGQDKSEIFVCRGHSGLLRGAWNPATDGNSFLTSDNEFATSLFGLAWAGESRRITGGSLIDAFATRGVSLCWALGKTAEEKEKVRASHVAGGLKSPPTGGTSLYPHRSSKKLKLAHLTAAAEDLSTLPIDEAQRCRLRMFRSLNPLNMYPLPRAGNVFEHSATLRGDALLLHQRDLGETTLILECVLAFLEEKYRAEGRETDFESYADHAGLSLGSLDLPALRAVSRELLVKIERRSDSPPGGGSSHGDAQTYDDFKRWARKLVDDHGHEDRLVNGELKGSDPKTVFTFTMDGFDDDSGEYNTAYRVAGDTRISALAYFLILDQRHGGDQQAIFRPDLSKTGGSLKPLLGYRMDDLTGNRVPYLELHAGEIKGWNVLSRASGAR